MRFKYRFMFLMVFLMGAPSVFAQTPAPARPQAQASSNTGAQAAVSTGRYELVVSGGYLGIGSGASQFDLGPGLNLIPFARFNWLQVGGEINYQKVTYRGGSTSNMLILAGITINLGGTSINDSFFGSLGLGMKTSSTSQPDPASVDPNGSGVYFIAGKRIPLFGGMSLRPSLGMVSGASTEILFRPVALSYSF